MRYSCASMDSRKVTWSSIFNQYKNIPDDKLSISRLPQKACEAMLGSTDNTLGILYPNGKVIIAICFHLSAYNKIIIQQSPLSVQNSF